MYDKQDNTGKNKLKFSRVIFMHYYQRLRDLREDEDRKQWEIAEILGISKQHYSQYERGERELPMHHFITLAKYYNTSLDYMAGLTNKKGGRNERNTIRNNRNTNDFNTNSNSTNHKNNNDDL